MLLPVFAIFASPSGSTSPPAIGTIPNQSVVYPGNTGAIGFTQTGPSGHTLTLSGTSNNEAVVPDGGAGSGGVNDIAFGGTQISPTVTVTPVATGTATITVKVTDTTTTKTTTTSFTVTSAINPSISAIANQNYVYPGVNSPVGFSISGQTGDTLVLSDSSTNPTAVPTGGITFGGSGNSPSFTVAPAATGSSIVTITVTDQNNGLSESTSFTVHVTAAVPPAISGISDIVVQDPGTSGAIPFSVGAYAGNTLTVTGSSDNANVVPNSTSNIAIAGSGSDYTVDVAPIADGSANITVTVTDLTTGLSAPSEFNVVYSAPPSLTAPANLYAALNTSTAALQVPISGPNGDSVTLTASGDGGIVTGVTVDSSVNPPTVTATVGGTSGPGTVSLLVTDNVTGLTKSGTFTVTAAALPTITTPSNQHVAYGGNTGALAVTVGGPGSDPLTIGATGVDGTYVTALSTTNPPAPTVTATVGTTAGYGTVTVTVTDGTTGLTASGHFKVFAAALPTVTAPATAYAALGTSTSPIQVTVAGPGSDGLSLAATDDTVIVTSVAVNNGANPPTVTATVGNTVGAGTVTLTVTDTTTGLVSLPVSFTVNAAALPTVTAPSTKYAVVGTSTPAIPVTVTGPVGHLLTLSATDDGTYVVSVVVNNDELAAYHKGSAILNGLGGLRTVTATAGSIPGAGTVYLRITDNTTGLFATTSYTVNAVNLPTVTAPSTAYVALGTTGSAIPVTVAQAQSDALTLSATADGTYVTSVTVNNAVSPPTVTPTVGNTAGAGTVNLTVTDNVTGFTSSASFSVNAAALPTIATIPTKNNSPFAGISATGPAADTFLITAVSSNQSVVSAGADININNPVFHGPASNSAISYVQWISNPGTTQFTVTVTDQVTGLSASTTFTANSSAVPTIASIATQYVAIGSSTAAIPVTVTGTSADGLTLTATSDNESVAGDGLNGSNQDITIVGATSGSPTISVNPEIVGSANITLTETDGLTGATGTTTFTVTAANIPTVTAPPTAYAALGTSTSAIPVTVSGPGADPLVLSATDDANIVTSVTVYNPSSGLMAFHKKSKGMVNNIVPVGPTVTATVGNTPGAGTVYLTVTDTVTGLSSTTVNFTVNAVNLLTVTPPATAYALPGGNTPAIPVTVSGPVGDGFTLGATDDGTYVTSVSVNSAVSPPTVTATIANSLSSGTVTLTALDTLTGLSSAPVTFTVTGASAPTITAIANQNVKIPGSSSALSFQVSDAATASNLLTVTATSDNEAVVGDGTGSNPDNIAFTGTGKYRHVTVTPQSVGTADITLTVTNGAGLTATSTFSVITDTAPSISSISNQTVNLPGQTGWMPYTVSDAVTPAGSLTVTTASSNTTVVPSASVVLHTVGSYNFVSVAPATGGSSVITLTVTNQYGYTATTQFTVTAVSGPTITSVSNQTVVLGSSTVALPVTLGGAGGDALTLASSSGTTSVVPNNGVVLTGSGTSYTVEVTPAAIGTSLITLTATDPSTGATATTQFTVTAISGPTLSGLSAQAVALGATGATQTLTVTDAVNPSGPFTVSYYSKNNTVLPKSGIAVVPATPNTFSVTVTPIAYGSATVVVTVTDTGTGLSANEQFAVTVAAPPTISAVSNQAVAVSTSTSALPVTLTGPTGDALVLTSSSANTTVVPSSAVVLAGSLDSYTVVVTPATTGSSVITLTVTDSVTTLSASTTFTVTSGSPVTVSGLVNEVTPLSIPGSPANQYFTVADASNPNGPFTVTTTSTNQSLVPNGGAFVTHTPSVAGQPFTLATEAYNIAGSTTITVKVTDNATHVSGTEQYVYTQAYPPTVSTPSDQTVAAGTSTSALPVTLTGPSGDSLVLTSSSANTTVLPSNNVVLAGSGTSYTVVVTPATTGSSVITLTVTDSTTGLTGTSTFTVTSASLPTLSGLADQQVVLGNGENAQTATVTDATNPTGPFTLAATATTNAGVLPLYRVTDGQVGTTSFLVLANPLEVGTATITMTVTDTRSGQTGTETFTVTVYQYAPTISAPGNQSLVAETSTGALPVTVGGAGGDALNVTASSANLTVVPANAITIGGTPTNPTITVIPAAVGSSLITLTATDPASGETATATFTVTATAATISIGNTSVLAGPSGANVSATFPVTLSTALLAPATVNYITGNGTGTAGSDYTAESGSISFPAGQTSGSISIPVMSGKTDASGLTFIVTISSPVNAAITTATGTATITHDATPVCVSIVPSSLTSPVNAAELLTATYSSVGGVSNLQSAGINIGKLSSAATSVYGKYVPSTGLFYLANASGTYIGGYAAGSSNTITTTMGTLNLAATTVTTNGNSLIIGWDFTPNSSLLGTQNLYLDATDNFGLTSGWQNLGTWTIYSATSAAINNTSVLVGATGSIHETFTVTLSAATQVAVSLHYATANVTATAGTDYTATSGTLVIAAGGTTGTINVPVANGQTDASGLTFTVTLSSPVNATITTATGTATIIHDSGPVAVSVNPNPANSAVSNPELLTATYSSSAGVSTLSSLAINIGHLSTPATSIYAKYVPSTGLFYVANAAGTYIGGYAAGSANTITTTMGTLNLANTTVSQTTNQVTIGWDFTPTSSLIGTQNVYLIASDTLGLSSGWVNLGTWTITSGGPLAFSGDSATLDAKKPSGHSS